ncbi:MAG TPA: MarR family transcriptional regulator [Nocardioidaceae bacterium]|nr:MarR family transcriptional regulator [Nocardioidaceae bacterium]
MQPSPFVLREPIPAPATAEDALMSLMMALGRQMRQRHPGDTIDYSALPLLKLLSHQGPMRLSSIAQVLGLDASTVSRHARQLEDGGLLARTSDPDDRRASRLAVSEHGNVCLAQGFETRRRVVASAMEDWTDEEREMLRVLLHRLVESLMTRSDHTEEPGGDLAGHAG